MKHVSVLFTRRTPWKSGQKSKPTGVSGSTLSCRPSDAAKVIVSHKRRTHRLPQAILIFFTSLLSPVYHFPVKSCRAGALRADEVSFKTSAEVLGATATFSLPAAFLIHTFLLLNFAGSYENAHAFTPLAALLRRFRSLLRTPLCFSNSRSNQNRYRICHAHG